MKKFKILVVDDSPISQKISKKFLENDGYEVISAWDGPDCLRKVKEEFPDAILMDVIMPDSDGKDVARELMSDEKIKKIPIIFTTNTINVEEDKGSEAFEIDGNVFRAFAKPLHSKKLLNVLRKEINRSIHGGALPGEIKKGAK